MIPILLLLSFCLVCGVAPAWGPGYPDRGWLSHNVYFELNDPTDEAIQNLIDGCWKHLSQIDGVLFFAVGRRAEENDRPVNDGGYHVALHVNFADLDAHDFYQIDSQHLTFVETFARGWKSVRVFDTVVEGQKSE